MMPHVRKLAGAVALMLALVLAGMVPAQADCGCVPPPGPGSYGSGDIGDWTASGNARYASPAADIDAADVWLLGDSITVAGYQDFTADLLAVNGLKVATSAWSGRPTRPTVDVLEQWVTAYGPPRAVVMASGTNDIFGPAPDYGPPVVAGQVDRVMSLVGPDTKVIWIETHISRWLQPANVQVNDQRNSGYVNSFLWEATKRHPNLSVSIWERYLSAKPSRVQAYLSDGVHTNDTGMNARNELARQAVVRALGI